MTTERDVRLVRVPHLRAMHAALARLVTADDPLLAPHRVVLVPTEQAARELGRTLERLVRGEAGASAPSAGAVAMPTFLTRQGLYARLHAGLGIGKGTLLSGAERQAILWRASNDVVARHERPPFAVRPGLVGEMLRLYDDLRRSKRTVDDFERVLVGELEPGAESDRGAARLLRQTRYLTAVYRGYEAILDKSATLDEHRLRARLMVEPPLTAVTHVMLTLADREADDEGLWPADYDLLTRLPGLARVDVVATENLLSAGFHARLLERLPGIMEHSSGDEHGMPVLVTPHRSEASHAFLSRDREEELEFIAATIRHGAATRSGPAQGAASQRPHGEGVSSILVVYQRPLPYVYLAKRVFEGSGLSCTIADALPLAAEPYAAALDLVLDAVASGFGREPLLRLLGSPVLSWRSDGQRLAPRDIAALDRWWRGQGFRAGLAEITRLERRLDAEPRQGGPESARVRRAMEAAVRAVRELAGFDTEAAPATQVAALATVLRTRESRSGDPSALGERFTRARLATLALLDDLARAYTNVGEVAVRFGDLASLVRRAIEERTFAPLTDAGGVRFADASAARYADADHVWIVGVVEGDWPAGRRKNIFYPASLLGDLGFPSEQGRIAASRASFHDLLSLARRSVAVSAFQLEEDAIVRPSVLLEDLDDLPLERVEGVAPAEPSDESPEEASRTQRPRSSAARSAQLTTADSAWLAVRTRRGDPADPRFHGATGPVTPRPVAVTAIERYLECPFKYFAATELALAEEDDAAETVGLDPRRRGTLMHEVFETFFREWERDGRAAITPALLPEARARFVAIVDRMVSALPEAEQAVERARLVGSAAVPGFGERVFRLEAQRPTPVVERKLEFTLRGSYDLGEDGGRIVDLRGKADRVDLLADGTLRIVDYKTGKAPHPKRSVQLAIYALCTEQKLQGYRGRSWHVGEAAYISFADRRPWVSIVRGPADRGRLSSARHRFLEALDGIMRGHFPPAPADRRLCAFCPYAAVCRKDYVGGVA